LEQSSLDISAVTLLPLAYRAGSPPLDARLVAPMRFEAGEQGDPGKSLLWSSGSTAGTPDRTRFDLGKRLALVKEER